MGLTLRESCAIAEIANLLYDFLPGSGSPKWKGHISFKTVADNVGVGDFWQPGSKIPMLTALLERTLESRRGRFEPLILEITRAALTYRQKQGNPIKPEEIEKLNGLIIEVGFKFPDLWDKEFIDSLRVDAGVRAKENVEKVLAQEKLQATERSKRSRELEELKRQFYELNDEKNRQKAGLKLEKILNRLFDLHNLKAREPFRIIGEQIDGSFELDDETYLIEAKWHQEACNQADLLIFKGVIEGKSKYTRGVFISINGVTREALAAITKGKEPCFFILDGHDITMLLEDYIDLLEFLRLRRRIFTEEGELSVPFPELSDYKKKYGMK